MKVEELTRTDSDGKSPYGKKLHVGAVDRLRLVLNRFKWHHVDRDLPSWRSIHELYIQKEKSQQLGNADIEYPISNETACIHQITN
jgi:hypothetical protein